MWWNQAEALHNKDRLSLDNLPQCVSVSVSVGVGVSVSVSVSVSESV